MGPSTTTTTSTGMAQPEDLTSPEGRRPWEDQSLPAQERYDAYRSVITDKCQALRESLKREGVTAEEKRVLAEDPNNKALVFRVYERREAVSYLFLTTLSPPPRTSLYAKGATPGKR